MKSFELYNLRTDLGEKRDLAKSHPDRLRKMAEQLRRMYREVRDESPSWPAWKWPREEGKRIRAFNQAEAAAAKKRRR